jgi:hypothetical protein
MATKLWFFAIAGLLLVAGADRIARRALRRIALWLAVLVSIAASGWVSLTSHHGGTLVYIHGVGTPNPVPCNEDEHAWGSSDEAADSSATDQRIAFFKHTVFPIISENCFQCHNPTKVANRKSGRLDLTSREALLKGGVNGPGIIEFKPEDSLLIQRIKHPDLEEVMPPEDPLSAEQIAAIEQWIRDGAIWR